jgi:hypothetical protein
MRENNPFEEIGSVAGASNTTDQASANAINALNEPKKSSGFFGALKNRKKNDPQPEVDIPPAPTSASDFSSSDSAYSPLLNETQPQEAPVANPPELPPNSPPETFQKNPPVAIDGVSPDYNAPVNQTMTSQYEQLTPEVSRYEDFQQAEQPYAAPQEQPMIYQQPYQQEYYPQADPYAANQPLPVNYNTAPNVYDPYNPYATMVDLNQDAPLNKKPDWKFVITFSIAIICFAGMIFFAINYAATNSAMKQSEIEILELQNKTTDSSKAASRVEDLTRELSTKTEDLKEANDALKKNEDKIKELETNASTLQTEKQSWQDKYYDVLTRCGDKCAGGSNTNSSSSSNSD